MILLDSDAWIVRNTVKKSRGVTMKTDIPPGTVIGDYLGKVVHPEEENESAQGGIYGMSWHDEITFLPSKNEPDHLLLINHSCAPNCGIYPFQGHILYASLRKIFSGEELTISYMVEPDSNLGSSYVCLCGEKFCRGTMNASLEHCHAFWDLFIGTAQKPFIPTLPKFGEFLKPLSRYPETVSDHPVWDLFGNTRLKPEEINLDKIPDIAWIRNKIRTTGRTLKFPLQGIIILGVTFPNLLLTKPND